MNKSNHPKAGRPRRVETDVEKNVRGFFLELQQLGYISHPGELTDDVNSILMSIDSTWPKLNLEKLNQKSGKFCRLSVPHLCKLQAAILNDKFMKDSPFVFNIKNIKQKWFAKILDTDHHQTEMQYVKFLEREGGTGELVNRISREDRKLFGDYFMYRTSSEGHVVRAFLRFYWNEYTNQMRMMGLRLHDRTAYLSSKGFVIRQKGRYLSTNYIVDRTAEGEQANGGVSVITIMDESTTLPGFIYSKKRKKIISAPALHYQSTYEDHFPTVSRAFLISIEGFEEFGGNADQTSAARFRDIRAFHEYLANHYNDELGLKEAAKEIKGKSTYNTTVYEEQLSNKSSSNFPFTNLNANQLENTNNVASHYQGISISDKNKKKARSFIYMRVKELEDREKELRERG